MDREDLRLAVYRAFAETGRAPDASALAAQFGAEAWEVVAGLASWPAVAPGARRPGRDRHGSPVLDVPLGFSVMGARTLWWGGCAWDSFALPLLAAHVP